MCVVLDIGFIIHAIQQKDAVLFFRAQWCGCVSLSDTPDKEVLAQEVKHELLLNCSPVLSVNHLPKL